MNPSAALVHHRLGLVHFELGRSEEAIAAFRRAIELKPAYAEAYADLAAVYGQQGHLEAGVEACRRAIAIDPAAPVGHCALGIALGELGDIQGALAAVLRATELKPDYEAAHSARLFLMNYSDRHSQEDVLDAHRRWAAERATYAPPEGLFDERDRTPEKRLRIGYVSADFRQHSVSFFLEPVLLRHDRTNFEVFCYSDVSRPDGATARMRGLVDCWRDVVGETDERLVDRIREDRIDVLVDLALHSGTNRLLTFARRAAPVQASWLGYAGTTGLPAMDYKITDAHLDPPGNSENWNSERLARLPDSYFCYSPPSGYPPVSPLPGSRRGYPTFGAFQNLAKVSDQTLDLWSGILHAIPSAKLILKARGLGGAGVRERLRHGFSRRGVASERIVFENWADMTDYLARFADVDIAVDTTPFNGGTTTLHALWMGVPVLTLEGDRPLARVGTSILRTIGLSQLIAHTPAAFAGIARGLTADPSGLAAMRSSLRGRLEASPLMDAHRFTAGLEGVFRQMWREWCEGR
jgi:predicted O-linked N-acetylglucosamine transferase (SPINDLY family)